MSTSVVLFRVHEDNTLTRYLLTKLSKELPCLRIKAVSYLKEKVPETGVFHNGYMVDAIDLGQLPYSGCLRTFNPNDSVHHNDLPVLHFFRANPSYDFYWIVEYDVHYSGDWGDLFETLSTSQADLLGTAIATRTHYPAWAHWAGLRFGETPIAIEVSVKAFLAFARLSRAALVAIDEACARGLTGHPEGTWPTICAMRNLSIEDVGGDGDYTPDRWRNQHYWNTLHDPYIAPGSFVFRPAFSKDEIDASNAPPMLWHPVKY